MADAVIMDAVATERFFYAIESSLKVARRFHFFLWAQGALQGVVPHGVLLCVHGDFSAARVRYDVFACNEVEAGFVDQFADPQTGPLRAIMQDWLMSERMPRLYAAGEPPAGGNPLLADMHRLGCGHVVAHGARDIDGEDGSFFIFLQMAEPPGSSHAKALDLVMPHMHMAFRRQLANERGEAAAGGELSAAEHVLSAREVEVLRWVREGKTNQEIGQELDISPLTVKNHMQKILRKLRVSNRAQAVAKGQSGRLLPPGSGPARAAGVCDRVPNDY